MLTCGTLVGLPCCAYGGRLTPPSCRALSFWQAVTRKTRILDVAYNASNNELVSAKKPVSGCRVWRGPLGRGGRGMVCTRLASCLNGGEQCGSCAQHRSMATSSATMSTCSRCKVDK
eukprot:364201-Chlamydomonas_euryale.AAC.14